MKLRTCSAPPLTAIESAKRLATNFADHTPLPVRSTAIELGANAPLSKWNTEFFFDYQIFPAKVLRFCGEWQPHQRTMRVGDIIVQRLQIPPYVPCCSLEFAVRIRSVVRDANRYSFAYETLVGHAECGVAEFILELQNDTLVFRIQTHSQPGIWMPKFADQWIAIPFQTWCTQQAMQQVRRRFRSDNHLTF